MFSLRSALSLPDPALACFWACTDIAVPAAGVLDNYDVMRYVHSVSLTHPFFASNGAYRAGKESYYVGRYDVNSITMNMYEDSNYSTHKMLVRWRNLICDRNSRAFALPVNYKGSITLNLLSGITGGSNTPNFGDSNDSLQETAPDSTVLTVVLTGVFPSTQSPTDLDFTNGGRIIVPVEFVVDDVQYIDPVLGPIE